MKQRGCLVRSSCLYFPALLMDGSWVARGWRATQQLDAARRPRNAVKAVAPLCILCSRNSNLSYCVVVV